MSKYYTQGAGAGRSHSPEDDFNDRPSVGSRQPLTRGRNDYYYEEPREQGFDVRADFDGDGPRWSEMYGVAKNETYRPVYDHDIDAPGQLGAPKPHLNQTTRDPEMVSVPVLGAEWTKDELVGNSKRGKKRAKMEKNQDNFRAWNRDQRGCCGIRWLTRTAFVFIAFFFIAALIVTLYFVIPRTVAFKFYQDGVMEVDESTIVVNRTPTNFSFNANLLLLADTTSSWIPVTFNDAEAKVFDGATSNLIATGHLGKKTLPHGKEIPVRFPVTFSYAALNMTDATWWNMYNACKYPWPGQDRATLNWRLEIKQSIIGMVPKPTIATNLMGPGCPFNFSSAV